MGLGSFFKKIGNAVSSVVETVVDVGTTVVKGVVKAGVAVVETTVEVVKEVANDIKKIWTKPPKPTPPPTWPVDPPTKGGGGGTKPTPPTKDYYDDDPPIDTITHLAELFGVFHETVCEKANVLENHTKSIYVKSYERIIKELEPFMDVTKIRKFINNKAKRFNNQMRDELNDVISQSNYKFMSIIDDTTKAQRYVDNAYNKASKNLYITLEKVIKETNNFIKVHTTRYLDEEKAALAELQQQYINLSKKGSTRDAELNKIAKEYASLLFIQEAVNSIKVN